MKTLVISAQDISAISFGLLEDNILLHEKDISVPPDGYLAALDGVLAEWALAFDEIGQMAIVTGPGSFTSARTSATIVNALAFTREIPVLALENPDHLPLRELVGMVSEAKPVESGFVQPFYDREPHITAPKS